MQTSVTLSCLLSFWHSMRLSVEVLGGSESKLLRHSLLRKGCQAFSTAKEAGERLYALCTCVNWETSL